MTNKIDNLQRAALLGALVIAILPLLSCDAGRKAQAPEPVMLTDERCRDALQRLSDSLDQSLRRPLKIRRQEDIEDQLIHFVPGGNIPFYFYRVSAATTSYADGAPLTVLLAVDRRSGKIYRLSGEGDHRNEFNQVMKECHLLIDLPESAISLADLYETLTNEPKFTFVRDTPELVADLADYYDPKRLHQKEARREALQVLRAIQGNELGNQYQPHATKLQDGYDVLLYWLDTAQSKLQRISFTIRHDGTVSTVTNTVSAALGQGRWCISSVYDRCDVER